MMSEKNEEKATRKERKKARQAFRLLLDRLRQLCGTFDRLDDWQDIVAKVEELLNTYQDAIPADKVRRIREAIALPEPTLKGINQACRVLQLEVEGLTKYLAPTVAVTTLVTAGVIVAAVSVLAVTIVSNMVAVDIAIHNEGCGDIALGDAIGSRMGIALADNLFLNVLGIRLPEEIQNGRREVLSLPPFSLDVDNETEADELKLVAWGEELRLPVGEVTDILFDDESLLYRRVAIDLGLGDTHDLIIRCEG